MLSCKETAELLSAYYDSQLDPQQRTMVEEHLSACAECSAEYEGLKKISAAVGEISAPEVTPAFAQALSQKLKETGGRKPRRFSWRYGSLVAASLVLIAVGVLGLSQKAAGPSVGSEHKRSAAVEATAAPPLAVAATSGGAQEQNGQAGYTAGSGDTGQSRQNDMPQAGGPVESATPAASQQDGQQGNNPATPKEPAAAQGATDAALKAAGADGRSAADSQITVDTEVSDIPLPLSYFKAATDAAFSAAVKLGEGSGKVTREGAAAYVAVSPEKYDALFKALQGVSGLSMIDAFAPNPGDGLDLYYISIEK